MPKDSATTDAMPTGSAKVEPLPTPLSFNRILRTWWPLAATWVLMMTETIVLSAFITRMFAPEINLAAWGIAYPVALIIRAPLLPIISASAALCKDWLSYRRVRLYLFTMAIAFATLHILITFTSLYDLFLVPLVGMPLEIIEPTRWGLWLLLPYGICMGIRRLNNGVLIRFGRSEVMMFGSLVRVGADILLILLFSFTDSISGIIVASFIASLGVIAEMFYVLWKVRPVLRNQLKEMPPADEPVTLRSFSAFYIPLAAMSVLYMTLQPLISSSLTRMPDPVDSLAIWPILRSLMMLVSSGGLGYLEAVVVLVDEPQSMGILRRFSLYLTAITTVLMLLMNLTPLGHWWFQEAVSLPPALIPAAKEGLWILTFVPGLAVIQNWLQGILVNRKKTRVITEAFVLSMIGIALPLALGILWGGLSGILVGMFAYFMGDLIRTAWLWYRARPFIEMNNQKERVAI